MQLSCERTANAVSRLFYQIPINGYASLNMGAISMMTNIVGGFTLVSLEDIDIDDFHVKAGEEISLVGKNAYYYLKYRNTDVFDSVSLRQARQEQFLTLYVDRIVEIARKDPTFFVTVYQVLENYLVTDLTPSEMVYLVTAAAFYDPQSVLFLSVPGEETMGDTFEEFYVDTDAFFPLYLQLFYNKQ
jgi:anionic cell wall polymer biosynthesis LytR-Cps2A-Psr (LCP) family protein